VSLPVLAETKRLVVREIRPEDVGETYVAGLNDPEVVGKTEAAGRAWSEAEIRHYVAESNQPGVSQLLGLMLKPQHRHIGNIRLFAFSTRHRRAELGIMLFDKTCWGRGLGTEALLAVCGYAFGTLGLHRICADYQATNLGSARIFAKAGFVHEGVFRKHFLVNGAFVDSIRVGKLDDD
jgi:ribosomal-protein-alanine N-acetyltransferase